jgi:hypothetical protein
MNFVKRSTSVNEPNVQSGDLYWWLTEESTEVWRNR